ncbi:hypothetical protein Hanom_Chr12g01172961 [Helianthus anomalus]
MRSCYEPALFLSRIEWYGTKIRMNLHYFFVLDALNPILDALFIVRLFLRHAFTFNSPFKSIYLRGR